VLVGNNNNTTDVMNVGSLANSGVVYVGEGATMNLTSQPNGITDAVAGSQLNILGTFKAGTASGVAKLGSVEGLVAVENNQSTTITPGGGALTISSTGIFDVDRTSTVAISGAVNNSGQLYTNRNNYVGSNILTVTGALTNTASGTVLVGNNNNTTDVMNVGSLANSGVVYVGEGATMNLTSQPNGITDAVAGSQLNILGTFKAGTASGVIKLGSVEGLVAVENNQSTTITPGGGALTISSTGVFDVDRTSTVTISGVVNNSGLLETNRNNYVGSNLLSVTGALTNNASGTVLVGNNNNTTDVMNVASLANSGVVYVEEGATINLTSQPNGITDAVAGSQLNILGTFKAGAASGVAKLGSVEGVVQLENNQTTTITPGSGTLTISSTGVLDVDRSSNVTISGAVNNSGLLETNRNNYVGSNILTVTGALTNNAGATIVVGNNNNTTDTLNTGTLANTGTVDVGENTTLNLTSSGNSTDAGTISLTSSTLKITGANVALNGAGTVTLSTLPGGSSSSIVGASPSVTFTNGATIQGDGTISNMGIVNNGSIVANQSTPLVILPSAAGLTNNGTLSVLSGDTMQVGTSSGGALTNLSGTTLTGGTYSVGGTLQFGAAGASIVTDAAHISLTGAGAKIIDFSGNNVLKNLAVITSAGSFTLGASYGNFTTTGNFTNNGILTVGAGDKFVVNLANSLTNFSGTTLTGGTYKITGNFQFKGANIVTNAASITLTGANSKITGTANANGLTNFATNAAGASFTLGTGRSFTTAGNFTNNGLLAIGSGDTFDINGNLTNFSGTTLTGGAYNVSGTLQFNGANIVTNAASITLGSSTAKIVNQTAVNALLGFTTNTAAGKFTLSGHANLATTGGNFTNAGLVTVSAGSTFTVGGSSFNFTQTAGTTTVDGALSGAGAGSLSINGGSLFGSGSLGYAVVDAGVISPGDSVAQTGKLAVTGTYSQSGAGALDVTIGGTTAGTKYDQLNITSTATLNGTLNISLATGYTPALGNTFDILNASSISGNFSTVNGLTINSSEHFTVTTVSGNEILLTVVAGPAPASSVNLTQLANTGAGRGRYGRGVYNGQRVLTLAAAPAAPPVATPLIAPISRTPAWRPKDEFASSAQTTVAPAAPSSLGGMAAPVASPLATMNHLRFECGVDLNALLKTSPKRLLKALWAAPDSTNAVNVGYMALTTR
jgi:protein involved in polysaccharide export with SLBB domain